MNDRDDRAKMRENLTARLVMEYPTISRGELLEALIAAKWNIDQARSFIEMANISEMPVWRYLALLEQK